MRRFSQTIQRLGAMFDEQEQRRFAMHGLTLAVVAVAALIRWTIDVGGEPQFWLFYAAIAVAAARGGAASAATAALASLLVARVAVGVSWTAGALFLVEGLTIAFVAGGLTRSVEKERRRLLALEPWMRDLKSSERQGRLVDSAFSRLDEAAETVVVLLDRSGRVSDWRLGATRLYGHAAPDIVGTSPTALFDDLSDDGFARLVADARQNGGSHAGRQRRADGTTFAADVQIRPLSRGGFDGFAMIVRDLTRQEAYSELQAEADVATRQLALLHHVTDPSLNALAGPAFITTILDRLRSAIEADGVALVYMERLRRRVLHAAGGLPCERGLALPPLDLRRFDAGRTVMIHNDAAGVAESSVAGWPGDVTSMKAVPVVRAGSAQAVMEVVNRRSRPATEWEIVLVQVAAARIAGFLQDDRYADSGAVA
jgi:PAS domain S-box-containing protein